MEDKKVCGRCKKEKNILDFNRNKSRKDGMHTICKICSGAASKKYRLENKEKTKAYSKKYHTENKEKKRKYAEEYRSRQSTKDRILNYNEENKDKIKQYHNKYYQENKEEALIKQKERRKNRTEEQKNKQRDYQKEYRIKNKEKIKRQHADRNRERYNNEPLFKLQNNLRGLIYKSFRDKNYTKKGKTSKIVGLLYPELKEYLEDNSYGFKIEDKGIDLDHIIPLNSATSEEELIKLNHYTNLQLLPSLYNRIIKKDKDFNKEDFEIWLEENKDDD